VPRTACRTPRKACRTPRGLVNPADKPARPSGTAISRTYKPEKAPDKSSGRTGKPNPPSSKHLRAFSTASKAIYKLAGSSAAELSRLPEVFRVFCGANTPVREL
jgi:hypothetical protein